MILEGCLDTIKTLSEREMPSIRDTLINYNKYHTIGLKIDNVCKVQKFRGKLKYVSVKIIRLQTPRNPKFEITFRGPHR